MRIRSIVCRLVVIATLPALGAANEETAHATSPQSTAKEDARAAEGFSCGRRAAWVYATLNGVDLDWDEMVRSFPSATQGVSLLKIRNYLESRGLECETRSLNPTDLVSITAKSPTIVFITRLPGEANMGHFVVVIGASQEGLSVIDPIQGQILKRRWLNFSDEWNGSALLVRQGPPIRIVDSALWVSLLGACCGIIVLISPQRKNSLRTEHRPVIQQIRACTPEDLR